MMKPLLAEAERDRRVREAVVAVGRLKLALREPSLRRGRAGGRRRRAARVLDPRHRLPVLVVGDGGGDRLLRVVVMHL